MKKFLAILLSVVLCAAVIPFGTVMADGSQPVKILAIGNSFSNNATQYISRIAAGLGKNVEVTSLYYAGCTLEQHMIHYNGEKAVYKLYKNGEYLNDGALYTMQQAFALDTYDYVTLQQSPSGSDVWSTYTPFLTQLYDVVKQEAPNSEILIHQTWSFCHNCAIGNDPYWHTDYNNSLEMFEAIKECYNNAAKTLNIDPVTGIIPVGEAIQLAKDEYGYGDFYNPGSSLTDVQSCANDAIYNDDVDHLNTRGRYIAACVWIEKILGVDCRNATYYPEGILTQEECSVLRKIAHETVTGEVQNVTGDWRTVPSGSGVKITHFMGNVPNDGSITIPLMIGDKKVVKIDDTVFKYVSGINTVIVSPVSATVEENAFNEIAKVISESKIVWDGTNATSFAGGSGTSSDPYLISNGAELAWAIHKDNGYGNGKYYKITKDIYLNDPDNFNWADGTVLNDATVNRWTPKPFSGTIDGDGHIIYGLYDKLYTNSYWSPSTVGEALISRVADNGSIVIKNLGLDYLFIHSPHSAAGFVGSGGSCPITITNSFIGANSTIKGHSAGAFVGWGNLTETGKLKAENCYSLANIIGVTNSAVAKIGFFGAAWNKQGTVNNCYSTGSMGGTGVCTFTNCYSVTQSTTGVTQLTDAQIQGADALENMPGLEDAFVATDTYPQLKVFAGEKAVDIWNGSVATALNGSGTEENPYLINNGSELAYAVTNGGNDAYFKITSDIYLNNIDVINWSTGVVKSGNTYNKWNTNKSSGAPYSFSGTIDGDGHMIYGLYADNYKTDWGDGWLPNDGAWSAGFVSGVPANKSLTLKNLGFDNCYIHAGTYAGIVGFGTSTSNITIENCFVGENGSFTAASSGSFIGAMAAVTTGGATIKNCYSLLTDVNSKKASTRNGFAGASWFTSGHIYIQNSFAKGLIATQATGEVATNCYSLTQTGRNGVTKVTESQMKKGAPIVYMPNLGDAYVTTDSYPQLKVFIDEDKLEPYVNFTFGYSGGNGTEANPYLISTATDLYKAIGTYGQGKYYKLTNDIYLNDIEAINWKTGEVIKDGYKPLKWFVDGDANGFYDSIFPDDIGDTRLGFWGTIDGNGYCVCGIYYEDANTSKRAGLIPTTYQTQTANQKGTTLKNLGIEYSHIGSNGRTGGFIGDVLWGVPVTLDKCFIGETATVRAWQTSGSLANNGIGGLIGYIGDSGTVSISHCGVKGNVTNVYPASTATIWTPASYGGLYYKVGTGRTINISDSFCNIKPFGASYGTPVLQNVTACYEDSQTFTGVANLPVADMKTNIAVDTMELDDSVWYSPSLGGKYPVLIIRGEAIGDVNGDGIAPNTLDLASLRKYLLGAEDTVITDINRDGASNILDLISLKKKLAYGDGTNEPVKPTDKLIGDVEATAQYFAFAPDSVIEYNANDPQAEIAAQNIVKEFKANGIVIEAVSSDNAAGKNVAIAIGLTNPDASYAATVTLNDGILSFNGSGAKLIKLIEYYFALPFDSGWVWTFNCTSADLGVNFGDGTVTVKNANDVSNSYSYVWGDEFNAGYLDSGKWNWSAADTKMGGTEKLKLLTDSRVISQVSDNGTDGSLRLQGIQLDDGSFASPVSFSTYNRMSYKYGYVEIRAKLPYKQGAWPSFWAQSRQTLAPRNENDYFTEVDIFEVFGKNNQLESALHKWYTDPDGKIDSSKHVSINQAYTFRNASNLNNEWHTYGFEWTPTTMSMYVDGVCYKTYNIATKLLDNNDMDGFQDPLFLIFNNHVITSDADDTFGSIIENALENLPAQFDIDYFRLYQNNAVSGTALYTK